MADVPPPGDGVPLGPRRLNDPGAESDLRVTHIRLVNWGRAYRGGRPSLDVVELDQEPWGYTVDELDAAVVERAVLAIRTMDLREYKALIVTYSRCYPIETCAQSLKVSRSRYYAVVRQAKQHVKRVLARLDRRRPA